MINIINTLEKLEPLTDEEREALLALQPYIKQISLKKGQYLYREGDIPDFVAYVNSGILRHVVSDTNDNEKILRLYAEESFIEDCNSFNEQRPVDYDVHALEDCELSLFKLLEVAHLYTDYPVFEKIGRKMMEGDASTHKEHLSVLMKFNPEERYKYILQNNPELISRLSVTHLAQYLDMTRETLSRMRAKVY